jgi:hypothetical protein
MLQYIIKIYNVKIEDIRLMQWIGICYFLCFGGNSFVAAVAYLACEVVVLLLFNQRYDWLNLHL